MGANFETMTLPGSMNRADVEKAFSNAQDQDRHENGHSYSGGFGMATGLAFQDRTFPSIDAAYSHLDDACRKWEDAVAVKYEMDGESFWMIGAVCAC